MEARRLAINLMRLAEAYRARVPQSLATLSRTMARDTALLDGLATSGVYNFTIRKYDATVQAFSNHWPDDLPWPDGIERPEQTDKLVQAKHGRPRVGAA